MTRRVIRGVIIVCIALFAAGCSQPIVIPHDIGDVSVAVKYAAFLTVGAAVNPSKLSGNRDIVDFHFNRRVRENDMKWSVIHPSAGTFNWTNADVIADYARARNIKITGHTLVWHSDCPDWG